MKTLRVVLLVGLLAVVGSTASAVSRQDPHAFVEVRPTGPLTVVADASNSSASAGIASYRFDFGDGAVVGPQPTATAEHTYAQPGQYSVTVTVTDTRGATATGTASLTITVRPFLPTPVLGTNVNLIPVSGTVKCRQTTKTSFRAVQNPQQAPVGTECDATKGQVRLVSVRDPQGRFRNTGLFRGSRFVVRQKKLPGAVTELRLTGGELERCGEKSRSLSSRAATPQKKPVRRLFAKTKGRFRTTGNYSSGTVRGTTWYISDRCDGTFIHVVSGRVEVRDLVRKRVLLLKHGQSYLARKP